MIKFSKYFKIYICRLSRARRVVENAFGILANRWQCLLSTLRQDPETVNAIIVACVCLHNIMRIRYPGEQNRLVDREDPGMNVTPGDWRDQGVLRDLSQARRGALATREARELRTYLKCYYNRIGAVEWQDEMI